MRKPKIALCFDFDGTLCEGNMQEYGLLQDLGYKTKEDIRRFWINRIHLSMDTGADAVHAYLYLICKEAKEKNVELSVESFKNYGKAIELFPGVENFISDMKRISAEAGCDMDAYVISSGIKDIITGTSIASYFKEIYACELIYGDTLWPSKIVDADKKTKIIQDFYFGESGPAPRENAVRYDNVIYIGDSLADTDCMSFVKAVGGLPIAVYGETSCTASALKKYGIAQYSTKANYRKGSKLYKLIADQIIAWSSGKEKVVGL